MRKLSTLVLIISSILMLNLQIQAQNLGIGTSSFNPDTSALVEMRGTKGLLIPRMSTAERNAIAYPAQSLLIFNTTTKCYEGYLDSAWQQLVCSFPCGDPLTVTHTAGSVAPETKTVTYGTVLTNLSGSNKCWITQNLGATDQASSATDSDEPSAGWYWQFNRKQGYKHDGTNRTPNTTWISSIDESSDWQAGNDPCAILLGSPWRIPTYTEWFKADSTGGWDNYTETYASVLKLHAAGYLNHSNGSLYNRGSYGYYWHSTQKSSTTGWNLHFTSGVSHMNYYLKAAGFSLRCLRD
jgi:hypothetical protein